MPCTHDTSSIPTPALSSTSHHHTHATQTTVHTSESQQQSHPHRVPQPHRQTKDDHKTTDTTKGHRPSRKSERNLIILQVNINGIKINWRSSNCLFTHTHADNIITIQETKLIPKANTPKIHNFTTVRTDRWHRAGGGLFTLFSNTIIVTTTRAPIYYGQ